MNDENPSMDFTSETRLERIFHWLWLLSVAAFLFMLGYAAGGFSLAVQMSDYVEQNYTCEAKQ